MRKNITVTASVRVSVTVRVSLVLFVSSNSFGGVKCRHLPVTVVSPVSDAIDTTVVCLIFHKCKKNCSLYTLLTATD